MFFFILLFIFFQLKNEVYLSENLNSNNKKKFVQAVKEIKKLDSDLFSHEFKKYLILLTINKFEEEIISSYEKNGFLKWIDQIKYYILPSGNAKIEYEESILSLMIYISGFKDNKYVEDIFKRFVCKELVELNLSEVIDLIKKYKKDILKKNWEGKNILNAVRICLNLYKNKKIELKDEDRKFLNEIYFEYYRNQAIKNRCKLLYFEMIYLMGKTGKDLKIIEETKKCICYEKYVLGVIKYEIELVKNNVKGTDILINELIDKEKENDLKKIHLDILDSYLNEKKINLNSIDLSKLKRYNNKYCEKKK